MPIAQVQLMVNADLRGTIKKGFFSKEIAWEAYASANIFLESIGFDGTSERFELFRGNLMLVEEKNRLFTERFYHLGEDSGRKVQNEVRMIINEFHNQGWNVDQVVKKWQLSDNNVWRSFPRIRVYYLDDDGRGEKLSPGQYSKTYGMPFSGEHTALTITR